MWPCQITKNLINLDLIEIVQFCLKIYDLWGHATYGLVYGWLGGWVVGWLGGLMDGPVEISSCTHQPLESVRSN